MYSNYNVSRLTGGSSLSGYGKGNPSYRTSYSSSYSRKSPALPNKPKVSLYSSTSNYTSSHSQPTTQNREVVRPRTRYHHDSTSMSRRPRNEDYSVPRSRTDVSQTTSLPMERGRDTMTRRTVNASGTRRDYSLPRARASSPATRKSNPVPEFTTIMSSSKSKVGRSTSLDRSARTRNPITPIEVKRTILKNDDQVREMDSYSPSFYENGTSKKSREAIDRVSLPSRSSTSSQRDEHYQNGYAESPSSTRHFNDDAGLIGLKNIGNTCFMNSILQCLSNTKSLRSYCLDEKKYGPDINHKSPLKGKLMEAFSELVLQLWHPSKNCNAVSTTGFKSQIQKFSKRFSGYDQQDCQEFMRFLIEGLHEDVNQVTEKRTRTMPNFDSLCEESKAEKTWQFYLSKDNSFIVDLFMGQLKSSLECQECGHVSVTFDPFWDLSLPLPKNSYRSYESSVTVTSCLQNFTKEEILDRDERPTCDKCKCRRRMTKKFTIYKFPKILVIHLKRFSEGSYRQKLTVDVDFSHKLKISSPVSTSDATFHLYSVSNHSGSCYGGHYTAYCKNPETKRWHCFNDSLVSSMSESSVQSREAYVLFYEQLSSRSHL